MRAFGFQASSFQRVRSRELRASENGNRSVERNGRDGRRGESRCRGQNIKTGKKRISSNR